MVELILYQVHIQVIFYIICLPIFCTAQDVQSVDGISLEKPEQKYGGDVHIRCSYAPVGLTSTNVQWSWSQTGNKASAQNIYYYDEYGNDDKEGRLLTRTCSKTHTTSEIGLIINNTIDIDDGTYYGELTKGSAGKYCTVNYTSWTPVTPTDIDYPLPLNISLKKGDNYVLPVNATNCSKPPMEITWKSGTGSTLTNTTTYNNGSSCHSDPNITSFGKATSTFQIEDAKPEQSGYLFLKYNHTSFTGEQTIRYTIQIEDVVTHEDIDYPSNNDPVKLKEGDEYSIKVTAKKCSGTPISITWHPEKLPNITTDVGNQCAGLATFKIAASTFNIQDANPEHSGYLDLKYNHPSFTDGVQTVRYTIQIQGGLSVPEIIGIAIGCILGLSLIAAVGFGVYWAKCKKK